MARISSLGSICRSAALRRASRSGSASTAGRAATQAASSRPSAAPAAPTAWPSAGASGSDVSFSAAVRIPTCRVRTCRLRGRGSGWRLPAPPPAAGSGSSPSRTALRWARNMRWARCVAMPAAVMKRTGGAHGGGVVGLGKVAAMAAAGRHGRDLGHGLDQAAVGADLLPGRGGEGGRQLLLQRIGGPQAGGAPPHAPTNRPPAPPAAARTRVRAGRAGRRPARTDPARSGRERRRARAWRQAPG